MVDQNRTSRVLIGESFVGAGAEAALDEILAARHEPANPFFTPE